MIRGIDFYQHCLRISSSIPILRSGYGEIRSVANEENDAVLQFNDERIKAHYVFNIFFSKNRNCKKKEYYLLQHFKGWIIETPTLLTPVKQQ